MIKATATTTDIITSMIDLRGAIKGIEEKKKRKR